MPGPSGKVLYPPYIQSFHGEALAGLTISTDGSISAGSIALTDDAESIMNAAWAAGNPYANADAYDPDSDLLDVQDRIDNFSEVF